LHWWSAIERIWQDDKERESERRRKGSKKTEKYEGV